MSKKIISILLIAMTLMCFGGCQSKQTKTLTLAVETGDVFDIVLDTSDKLSMGLDDNTGAVYFYDSNGMPGAYLMFVTEEDAETMFEQFDGSMTHTTMGKYDVDVFYTTIGTTSSVIAYQNMGNTGVVMASAYSEDTIKTIFEYLDIKLIT